jgi:hypothetical protein
LFIRFLYPGFGFLPQTNSNILERCGPLLMTTKIWSEGPLMIVPGVETLGTLGIKAKRMMTQEVNKQMVDVKNHPFFYEMTLKLFG